MLWVNIAGSRQSCQDDNLTTDDGKSEQTIKMENIICMKMKITKLESLYKEYRTQESKYESISKQLSNEMGNAVKQIKNDKKLSLYYCLIKALHKGCTFVWINIEGFEETQSWKEKCPEYINFLLKILKEKQTNIIKVKAIEKKLKVAYEFNITDNAITSNSLKEKLNIHYKDFKYLSDLRDYIFDELKPIRKDIKKNEKNKLTNNLSEVEKWVKDNKLKMSFVEMTRMYETTSSMDGSGTGNFRINTYGCIKIEYKKTIYYINHLMVNKCKFTGSLQDVVSKIKEKWNDQILICASSLASKTCIVDRDTFIKNFNKYEGWLTLL